jgi:hypothetical protein
MKTIFKISVLAVLFLTAVVGKNAIRVENAGFLRRFLESFVA